MENNNHRKTVGYACTSDMQADISKIEEYRLLHEYGIHNNIPIDFIEIEQTTDIHFKDRPKFHQILNDIMSNNIKHIIIPYAYDIPDMTMIDMFICILSGHACKLTVLDNIQSINSKNPTHRFITQLLPKCKWTLLPFNFLYPLYTAWFHKNYPLAKPLGRNEFISDLCDMIDEKEWTIYRKSPTNVGSKMTLPEPLILEYNLKDWMNPTYKGTAKDKICTPPDNPYVKYRGILRKQS